MEEEWEELGPEEQAAATRAYWYELMSETRQFASQDSHMKKEADNE